MEEKINNRKFFEQDFELSPEQKELVDNTTLIVPDNDGEAHLTIEIVKKLGINVQISNQAWGAKLDKELNQNTNIDLKSKRNIWVFEMPSKETEDQLKNNGVNIEIIDHHLYEGDDRSCEASSIEQFLAKIKLTDDQLKKLGFDNRFVKGISINDKAYIYGLRKEGFSNDEIKKIREYDIQAQFKDRYEAVAERNKEIYNNRQVKGDIVILETKQGDSNTIAVDKIVLENKDNVVQILDIRRNDEGKIIMLFLTGPTGVVQFIKGVCSPSFGGSSKTDKESDFVAWINPVNDQIKQIEKSLGVSIGV